MCSVKEKKETKCVAFVALEEAPPKKPLVERTSHATQTCNNEMSLFAFLLKTLCVHFSTFFNLQHPSPLIMAEFLNTPNSELDEQQIRLKEEFQISQGPLSVLQSSVRNHTQILISLRNNKKLLARVKAFDRHSNMVLENVKEVSSPNLYCATLAEIMFICFFS